MSPSPQAPVVGVGAVVWKNQSVLLIRRSNPPLKGQWSLPGGKQQLGETVHQAAIREVLEETGVTIQIFGTAAVIDLIDRDGEEIRFHYTVIDVSAEWVAGDALAGDDADDVAWVRADQLDDYAVTEAVHSVVAVSARQRSAPDRLNIGPVNI